MSIAMIPEENNMYIKPGTYHYCPECKICVFASPRKRICKEHETTTIKKSLTDWQRMRLVSTIYCETVAQVLRNETQRHEFGAFFLTLEAQTDRMWMPDEALLAHEHLKISENIRPFAAFIYGLEFGITAKCENKTILEYYAASLQKITEQQKEYQHA